MWSLHFTRYTDRDMSYLLFTNRWWNCLLLWHRTSERFKWHNNINSANIKIAYSKFHSGAKTSLRGAGKDDPRSYRHRQCHYTNTELQYTVWKFIGFNLLLTTTQHMLYNEVKGSLESKGIKIPTIPKSDQYAFLKHPEGTKLTDEVKPLKKKRRVVS